MFALFIIGFMAFSTVAFVLSAGFGDGSNTDTTTPDTNDPIQPTTQITYTAEVDANVLEVFPSFKMMGDTKEYDISRIDSTIAQIEGITRISSVFRQVAQQQGGQSTTYYIADVSFDSKKTDFEKISGAISEKTSAFFGQVGFFPNALIVVPKKIQMQNTDLGLSKEYEIEDNVIQSYLNSGTMKGDGILARVEISFSGNQPINTLSSEISNNSSTEKEHTASLSLPLVELKPELTFTADANYSDMLSAEEIKGELLKIKDVNSAEVLADPIYYNFLLTVKKPFADSLEQDLNSAIPQIKDVTGIQFFSDENSLNAIIGFPEGASLAVMKSDVAAELSGLNVPSASFYFTEPAVSYAGSIMLETADAKEAANSVNAFFNSNNFSSKLYQLGLLEVQSLADNATNEGFAVDSNSIEAAIYPGHKKGDEIFASIVFYSQRGKLLDAKGIEVISPVRVN